VDWSDPEYISPSAKLDFDVANFLNPEYERGLLISFKTPYRIVSHNNQTRRTQNKEIGAYIVPRLDIAAVSGDQQPMLVYANREYGPDDPWSRLFKNQILVWVSRFHCYLFAVLILPPAGV
jgi:hypothetical protein